MDAKRLAVTVIVCLTTACGSKHAPAGARFAPVRSAPVAAPTAAAPRAQHSPSPSPAPSPSKAPASASAPSASAPGAATAPVASSSTSDSVLSLDEIMASDVVYEDLTPDVTFGDDAEGSATLTQALFSMDADGVVLETAFEKPDLWVERRVPTANARWVIEDPGTGAQLATGDFSLPTLCSCDAGDDHLVGDVRLAHSATFHLDLPRIAPHERLRIVDATGAAVASFSLDLGD